MVNSLASDGIERPEEKFFLIEVDFRRKTAQLNPLSQFQDLLLSEKVRSKAGIPLLFIDGHTIVLEAPSEKSKKRAARAATDKMQTEHGALAAMKEQLLEGEKQHKKKRKRKGPKGPNPLSCKKPKNPKDKLSAVEDGKVTKKRKRSRHKRARVADHLKEHFKKLSLE